MRTATIGALDLGVSRKTDQAAIRYARLVAEKKELEEQIAAQAEILISRMGAEGITTYKDIDEEFSIDLCTRKTFVYPESVRQIESTLKREKELAVLTGVATVATETTFLRVR